MIRLAGCLFPLTAPIQIAVLNGFRDVIHLKRWLGCQIRNGAGDLEHPVKGSGRKPQFVDGRLQKAARGVIDLTVDFDMAAAHLGVAKNFCARKPCGLNGTAIGHALTDCRGTLGV